jgi:outer membrane protein assembly factor BamA
MGSRSQSNDYVLKDFVIEGNKKTKEWLILRESGYKKGDIIAAEELDAAIEAIRRNVANLQLFLHVTVHPVVLTDNNLLVLIQVAERWYLYPIPYVRLAEPNFNTWLRNSTESRTNYGIKLKQFNFRGRDERLEWTFQSGYARELGLKYSNPYLLPNKNWGVQVLAHYKEFGEINIGTFDNERVFYSGNSDTRTEQRYALGTSYRPDIYSENIFMLSYQNIQVSEGVRDEPGIQLQRDGARMRYFSMAYSYDYADVDDRSYPTKGEHFIFTAEQLGLGFFDDSPSVFRTDIAVKVYRPLSKKFTLQNMVKGQASLFEKFPYYLQDGLGYGNNSIRSYEYYVMDSQFYILSRNNLQFNLLPDQKLNMDDIGKIPMSKLSYSFYLNLIADIGYAGDRLYANQNPLNNTWLMGTGLGLDFVTSYGAVFRMEYTVNKLGEDGFYLHYRKSI